MLEKNASPPDNSIDFSLSGVSRYIQLGTLFRRLIESGRWPVGAQIPTVDDLAADYGVARATVRQALDLLGEEKLIERFRAKGTFVTRKPQEQLWCEVGTDWNGLLMARDNMQIEILNTARDRRPGHLMHALGKPVENYRYWKRLHFRDNVPYHVGEVYIDERLCKRIPLKDLRSKTSMRLLRDLPGLVIQDARQTLTLGSADPDMARLLQIPLNAPVALVQRTIVDEAGELVFVGDGVYRGDMVRLDIKLS